MAGQWGMRRECKTVDWMAELKAAWSEKMTVSRSVEQMVARRDSLRESK